MERELLTLVIVKQVNQCFSYFLLIVLLATYIIQLSYCVDYGNEKLQGNSNHKLVPGHNKLHPISDKYSLKLSV